MRDNSNSVIEYSKENKKIISIIIIILLLLISGFIYLYIMDDVNYTEPECSEVDYNGDGTINNPFEIHNDYTLQCMNKDLDAHYVLVNDIDASGTNEWNNGEGFTPIGDWEDGERDEDEFTGSLDGQGYEIDGLYIDRDGENRVGLIGYNEGTVENIGVVNINVTGLNSVGGLIGDNRGEVRESYAEGSVTGDTSVGGLVGDNFGGAVSESYATGTVTGEGNQVGGLVGDNFGGTVSESYATGDVTGEDIRVGGLVGENIDGDVSESYATGDVTGESWGVGGLVGGNNGDVSESYATGSVTGDERVGGIVGLNDNGTVSESYATGDVTGESWGVGGLVGSNFGEVSESYAEGSVTGFERIGGLVGSNTGTMGESYATGDVTGEEDVGGLVGLNNGVEVSESYSTGSVTGFERIGGLIGQIGIDSSFADDDHILRDSYVLDSEMSDENKVIGEIVEGEGDGNVGITHGETDITTVNNEDTFEDINVEDLNNAFIRSEEEFQDENELEQFDFDESWIIIDDYPILQWQE